MMEAVDVERRKWVLSALAGVGLAGCGGGGLAPAPDSGVNVPAGQAWRNLAPLLNEAGVAGQFSASLAAAPASATLVAGVSTQILAYNGTTPGPLIEAYDGDHVRIAFSNRLATESTIHWHGMPVPADQDGNPMDPVAPGSARAYEFDLPAGSAGSYWYHPHPHQTTHEQVFRGLASAFVVHSRTDPLGTLPERLVFITDMRLDAGGQIAPNTATDFNNGREGDQLLINGVRQPLASAAAGRTERWRIYNATSARYLQLKVDGSSMVLVALDGSMLAAPVGVSRVLLAPAQRADIVVRVPTVAGQKLSARTVAYSRGMGIPVKPGEMLFEVAAAAGAIEAALNLPATLPAPAALGVPQRSQSVVLNDMGMGMGMGGSFTINGRVFDPARNDLTMFAGVTEEWTVRNDGMMDHPLHIHGCAFQLVASSRSDMSGDPRLGAFMDVVNLRPGETIRLRLRIDTPGRRMFHCHILEHEDQGMMAIANVLP